MRYERDAIRYSKLNTKKKKVFAFVSISSMQARNRTPCTN